MLKSNSQYFELHLLHLFLGLKRITYWNGFIIKCNVVCYVCRIRKKKKLFMLKCSSPKEQLKEEDNYSSRQFHVKDEFIEGVIFQFNNFSVPEFCCLKQYVWLFLLDWYGNLLQCVRFFLCIVFVKNKLLIT